MKKYIIALNTTCLFIVFTMQIFTMQNLSANICEDFFALFPNRDGVFCIDQNIGGKRPVNPNPNSTRIITDDIKINDEVEVIIFDSIDVNNVIFDGLSSALFLDGSGNDNTYKIKNLGDITKNTKNFGLLTVNQGDLTISERLTKLNTLILDNANFYFTGTTALLPPPPSGSTESPNHSLSINDVNIVKSNIDLGIADLIIKESMIVKDSNIKAHSISLEGDSNIALTSKYLNSYAIESDKLILGAGAFKLNILDTSNINQNNSVKYLIAKYNTISTLPEIEDPVVVGMVDWIYIFQDTDNDPTTPPIKIKTDKYWLDYQFSQLPNSNEFSVNFTRTKGFEDLAKENSYASTDQTYLIAKSLDNIMKNSQDLDPAFANFISTLDLTTGGNSASVLSAISTLVPISNNSYITGAESLLTASSSMVVDNLLEDNMSKNISKVWVDSQYITRSGFSNAYKQEAFSMQFGYTLHLLNAISFTFSSGATDGYLASSNTQSNLQGTNYAYGLAFNMKKIFYASVVNTKYKINYKSEREDYSNNLSSTEISYNADELSLKFGRDFYFFKNKIRLNNFVFFNDKSMISPSYAETGSLSFSYDATNANVEELGYNLGLSRVYVIADPDNFDSSKGIKIKDLDKLASHNMSAILMSFNIAVSQKAYSGMESKYKFINAADGDFITVGVPTIDIIAWQPSLNILYIHRDYSFNIKYTYEQATDLYTESKFNINLSYKF
jgi:hypothetical protein